MGRPDAPADRAYRRVPLNTDAPNTLHRGTPAILRYDPEDPRRAVVVRTGKALPPTANLVWCVCFSLSGVGTRVCSLL